VYPEIALNYRLQYNHDLHNPAVGSDQFRQNLKPTCLPFVRVSLLEVFLHIGAIQMYFYLLTCLSLWKKVIIKIAIQHISINSKSCRNSQLEMYWNLYNTQYTYTLCPKKYCHLFVFYYNSVKCGSISIIFGIRSSEETLHQKVVNLSTSPKICHRTTLCNFKKSFFKYITLSFQSILAVFQ